MKNVLALAVLCTLALSCRDEPGIKHRPLDLPDTELQPPPADTAEEEPNDSLKEAQRVELPRTVRGSFKAGSKPDEDWYLIAPPSPVVLSAELTAPAGVPVTIDAHDAGGERVARWTGTGPALLVVPNHRCRTSCFLRVATTSKDGGDYTLVVKSAPPSPRAEAEPNNRAEDAQPLTLGSVIDGYFGAPDDEDWFALRQPGLAPDEVLSVHLTPPKDVRAELELLRASDRTSLTTYRAREPGEPIRLRNLSAPGQAGYLLVVRSASVKGPDGKTRRGFDTQATYTLEAKAAEGAPGIEAEPNDTAALATPIALEAPTRSGFLAPQGDVDWYAFTVDAPSVLRAAVSGVENVDLVLSVVEPAQKEGAKDVELARADDGGVGEPEVLAGIAVPAGRNLVRIAAAGPKKNAAEEAQPQNQDAPYELVLETFADDGTFEREPNGKVETATPVAIGQQVRGYIHPARDVDVYRLEVTEARNVAMTVSGVSGLDLAITVRDAGHPEPNGALPIVGTIDRARAGGEERLVVPFDPGTYAIEVRAKARESNPRDTYTLTLK